MIVKTLSTYKAGKQTLSQMASEENKAKLAF